MYRELNDWRVKYFYLALRELLQKLDEGSMLSLLAELTKAGMECLGRKRVAFFMIMDVVDPTRNWEMSNEESNEVERSKRIIKEYMTSFIDQFKLKAFRMAFVEPAMAFFAADGDIDSVQNVNVHGFSAYSTVVLATLSVRVPMIGYMDDNNYDQGCIDFRAIAKKDPELMKVLEAFGRKENFGKGYGAISETKTMKVGSTSISPPFIFTGQNPRHLANEALRQDDSPDAKEKREHLAGYLETFMSFFKTDFFVEKAIVSLIQEREKTLEVVFKAMMQQKKAEAKEDGNGYEDELKFWLWDVMSGSFSVENGVELLKYCEILK
jgi:hypothetical protein